MRTKRGASAVVVTLSVIVILLIVGIVAVIVVEPSLNCYGQACLGTGQNTNPINGQTTYNAYIDVVNTRNALGQVSIAGTILPAASSTGEVLTSCNLFICQWFTGIKVTASITVTCGTSQVLGGTWNFELGLGDHEEYIWKAAGISPGQCSVTVSESLSHFYGTSNPTLHGTFSVPVSGNVQLTATG